MLTVRQREAHQFICDCFEVNGIAPSFEEIQHKLGMCSKSGVAQVMHGLETRGYIRRLKYRARAVEVLRRPDGSPVDASFEALIAAADAVANRGADRGQLRRALIRYRRDAA